MHPFLQQSRILSWKNLLVAWRNRRATVLRLLAPLVFLLLALLIQLSLDANNRSEMRVRSAESTQPAAIGDIPSCNSDLFIGGRACQDFLFAPNTSSLVQDIVAQIRRRNSPPIPESKVLGFASRSDADDHMLRFPETSLGAVFFSVDAAASPPGISYIIASNTTTKRFKGVQQSPLTWFTLPFTAAVAREVSRVQLFFSGQDGEAMTWEPQLAVFPHPQLRSMGRLDYILGPFIFAACMFSMVMQLAAITSEKESGLLTLLRRMGMRQSTYWVSWFATDVLLGLVTTLTIVIWGLILQFRFFLRNDAGLLVLLFFLFSLALSSFSYFLSVFVQRSQSSTYLGFAVFLIGWITQTCLAFGLPYDPAIYFGASGLGKAVFWIFATMPWCPLAKGTLDLAAATSSERDPGLRWSQRSSYCQYIPDAAAQPPFNPSTTFVSYDCLFPLQQVYVTLIIQAAGWFALTVYLDSVMPGNGQQGRPPWFFLLPSFWFRSTSAGKGLSRHAAGALPRDDTGPPARKLKQPQAGVTQLGGPWGLADASSSSGSDPQHAPGVPGSSAGPDDDVVAEEARMQAMLRELLAGSHSTGPAAPGGGATLVRQISWPRMASSPLARQWGAAGAAALAATGGSSTPQSLQVVGTGGGGGSDATDAECQVLEGGSDGGGSSSINGGGGEQRKPSTAGGYSVAVLGLSKVFAPSAAARCGGARDFTALRRVWLGVAPGQLFALLGHNGAGKSTMIGLLTGLLAPSGGEMLVCGESILREGGLERARANIGVCAQFDCLWLELTGLENLVVAGHIKGLPWREVRRAARDLLARVQLSGAASLRSSAYSGGMKRRLSVAQALVGDPQVLFLDEPTTGMDPISRRAVWDVIQASKPGRAIILTTHSMEEADVLGDRVGIIARGQLKALGSSLRLKQAHGAGYFRVTVTLKDHPAAGGLRQRKPTASSQRKQVLPPPPGAAAAAAPVDSSTPSPLADSGPSHVESVLPDGRQHSGAAAASDSAAPAAAVAAAKAAVRQAFAEQLGGLAPHDDNKRSLTFLVPRALEGQLVDLLQRLEAAMGDSSSSSSDSQSGGLMSAELAARLRAGVADVQLSLTSLEEVFLAISKKAELEASVESGATVTITLPDSGGRTLQVHVGQEWVQDAAGPLAGAAAVPGPASSSSPAGGRRYFIKWAQDERGALAVEVVVPVVQAAAAVASGGGDAAMPAVAS